MARRRDVLENVRNNKNTSFQRTYPRNRTRNRNAVSSRNENATRPVPRRIFRPKNKAGGLARRPAVNANENRATNSGNRFRRNKKGFVFRRFNSNLKTKQNFKKNKEAKTADQMDMELDTYMGGEATKAKLDSDLTKYFQEGSSEKS